MTKPELLRKLEADKVRIEEQLDGVLDNGITEESLRQRNILRQNLLTCKAKINNVETNQPLYGFTDSDVSIIKSGDNGRRFI